MAKKDAGRLTEIQQVVFFGILLGVISGIVSGIMAGLLILAFNHRALWDAAEPIMLTFLGSIMGGLLLSLIIWTVLHLLSRQASDLFSWPTESLKRFLSKSKEGGDDEQA